jgi:hypothetical protein
MEYTIVERDYNELNLCWVVMSNGNGATWGAFATLTDAILFVVVAMHPGKIMDSSFVW